MKTKISLLFYLKKPKNYQKGPVPIYLRITVESKRAEFTTGREFEPNRWNAVAGRVTGTKEAVKSTNSYLGNLKQQLLDARSASTGAGYLSFLLFHGLGLLRRPKAQKKSDSARHRRRAVDIQPADENERQIAYSAATGSASHYRSIQRQSLLRISRPRIACAK